MIGKYNLFGKLYRNPGETSHAHLIPVTLEERVQIAESDITALEERVASLEKNNEEIINYSHDGEMDISPEMRRYIAEEISK